MGDATRDIDTMSNHTNMMEEPMDIDEDLTPELAKLQPIGESLPLPATPPIPMPPKKLPKARESLVFTDLSTSTNFKEFRSKPKPIRKYTSKPEPKPILKEIKVKRAVSTLPQLDSAKEDRLCMAVEVFGVESKKPKLNPNWPELDGVPEKPTESDSTKDEQSDATLAKEGILFKVPVKPRQYTRQKPKENTVQKKESLLEELIPDNFTAPTAYVVSEQDTAAAMQRNDSPHEVYDFKEEEKMLGRFSLGDAIIQQKVIENVAKINASFSYRQFMIEKSEVDPQSRASILFHNIQSTIPDNTSKKRKQTSTTVDSKKSAKKPRNTSKN